MRKFIINSLILTIPVFALCEFNNVEVDMFSKQVPEEGYIYRRADVYITVPMKVRKGNPNKSLLPTQVNIVDLEGNNRRYIVSVMNNTGKEQDSLVLVHNLEDKNAMFMEDIIARKIISYSPFISEQLTLVPTEIKDNRVLIRLPSLAPGEELVLSYVIKGETKPSTVSVTDTAGIKKFIEEEEREVLVAKYSFLFGFASTRVNSPNIENIREVIEGLERLGFKAKVKIVGMADGKTTNPKRNKMVAKKRAENVARSIFGNQYACVINRAYAGSRTETPSE